MCVWTKDSITCHFDVIILVGESGVCPFVDLNLYFPSDKWCWTYFYTLINQYNIFVDMFIQGLFFFYLF